MRPVFDQVADTDLARWRGMSVDIQGYEKLMEIARTNRNPEVRKQAMFWLGQSKDPRALDFFAQVLAK